MAWIEGITNTDRLVKDLINILCTANKDINGLIDPLKNWELIYPIPIPVFETVTDEILSGDPTNTTFMFVYNKLSDQNIIIKADDGSGNFSIVDSSSYIVDYSAGTVTFVIPQLTELQATYEYITDDGLLTALSTVTSRAIVKTTTTPSVPGITSSYGIDTTDQTTLSMYVEFYMPPITLNTETGIWTDYKNYYYLECRMFDVLDEANMKPKLNIYDSQGNVSTYNSHTSEWARFSWFKDSGEQLKDVFDKDAGISNIEDGLVYDRFPTAGIFGTMGIEFYISTDNDHITMVLVGDPTVDYDNYLISFGYIGKIDSFEDSVNDTSGNFALTVSSAEVPCFIDRFDVELAINEIVTTNQQLKTTILQPVLDVPEGLTETNRTRIERVHKVSYKFLPYNDRTIGDPLRMKEVVLEYTEEYEHLSAGMSMPLGGWAASEYYNCQQTNPANFKISFESIPKSAIGIRVYAKKILTWSTDGGGTSVPAATEEDTDWYFIENIPKDTASTIGYIPKSIDGDHSKIPPITQFIVDNLGVIRDEHYGSIKNIIYPKTWGLKTATGVSDISMYRTRNGAYYQQHYLAFITPEQTMQKDAFNPSRWTGKFHMSPAYVVQGYDGYRGWLKNVVVVDDSSIVHLDKLIVNKGSTDPDKPEEIYRYFNINAPFSCLTNSPNFHYGIAIKEV